MASSYQYNQSEAIANMSEWTASYRSKVELVHKIGMAQGIIGMVLNTVACLVILRTKRLHNVTNYLLAYLAVTDCIFCFSVVLYHCTDGGNGILGRIYTLLIDSRFAEIMIGFVSSFDLCLVTYERYIGIVHPLHYPRWLNGKKVTFVAFLSWIVTFLFLCPTLFLTSNIILINTGFYLFGYLFTVLFMSWACYKIQATLKRSAQQLQQQNVKGAALELLQARQKVINMLRIVTAAMFVLWTPLAIWLMLCSLFQDKKLLESKTGQLVTLLVIAIFNMNSVINPIIYVFKYKKFRKGLQDMLCCCIGRPQRPNRIEVQIVMNEHTT